MSTLLEYTLNPDLAFANSENNLKLLIKNSSNQDVTFKAGRGGDTISITFPSGDEEDDMVKNLDFNVGSVTTPFICSKSGTNFVLSASKETTIFKGQSISVTFEDVPINSVPGDTILSIKEFIDGSSASGSVAFTKEKEELGVILWLDPTVVALGQKSKLQFKSSASDKVTISGLPGTPKEKTFETPPYSGSLDVTVDSDVVDNRPFTAIAKAGVNQSPPTTAVLYQSPPSIPNISPDKQQTIGAGEEVTMEWTALYASKVIITGLGNLSLVNPDNPLKRVPGKDLTDFYNVESNNAQNMPETVPYKLTAMGFEQPVSEDFSFKINPVELLYVKYATEDFSTIVYATKPDWAGAIAEFAPNMFTLKIYQPGGGNPPDTYYLSTQATEHPMIQFFDIVDGKLKWITVNLTEMDLDGTAIASEQIPTGTADIPEGVSQVVLSGKTVDNVTIRSVLDIPQN